jgi:histidine triad (HIT) family protein
MASIFTKIIDNQIPAYRVYEDEHVIAILALDQVTPGHTIVIPKIEVDHHFEVPEPYYSSVFSAAKKISKVLKDISGRKRVLTAAIGFEVNHFHYHLIPADNINEFNFSQAKKLSAVEMQDLQNKISESLKK